MREVRSPHGVAEAWEGEAPAEPRASAPREQARPSAGAAQRLGDLHRFRVGRGGYDAKVDDERQHAARVRRREAISAALVARGRLSYNPEAGPSADYPAKSEMNYP